MKQSTKLLSLVLALIMAFSFMTVIGNAAETVQKNSMQYDSIDDAILNPEQVADIAIDFLDDILADANIVLDISVAKLDLTSVDNAFSSLNEVGRGTLLGIASFVVNLGVIEDLSFDDLGPDKNTAWQSGTNGNLFMIKQLLAFLKTNAADISPIAYGIGTSNGIDLGIIGNFVDLGEIQTLLADIPGLLKNMVYDLVLAGSSAHPQSSDELDALPYGGDLDQMLTNALLNLLITPQDSYYDENDVKQWDPDSILLPSVKAYNETHDDAYTYLDLTQKSVFDILNALAQFAIDDLGVNALNHNLKKNLMEAVEVEFNQVEESSVPADVMDIFKAEEYVTYIGYDCLEKSATDGKWYYTTFENVPTQDTDPETGEILTVKEHVYYKANTATANSFYDLINWEYKILKSTDENAKTADWTDEDGVSHGPNTISYDTLLEKHGTLAESLNHLVYIVFRNALKPEVQADFEEVTHASWVDGKTSLRISNNIERLIKYLLVKFPDKIFGQDSAYATNGYEYEYYENMSLIDIVALIGPGFFGDVMPQLVMPQNEDGTYGFAKTENGESVALLQFGALVIREFTTEIAPNVNYDNYIFAANTLTSASGRQFADLSAEQWFNLILNMGVDIGYTYLYNITNFGDTITFTDNSTDKISNFTTTFTARTSTLPVQPTSLTEATDATRWQGKLDAAINWAVTYVGSGDLGVLTGIDPKTVEGKVGPFNKLSYILNTLLPLGFVNGCESATYDLDVEVLFNKVKSFLTTFDLSLLVSLFGRNGVKGADADVNDGASTLQKGNILAKPVVPMVLDLVNSILYLVFGANILPYTDNLNGLLTQANLKTIIETLLTSLYNVRNSLLNSALPVVGKLIKGWGTEQSFESPSVRADSIIEITGGTLVDGNGNLVNNEITVSNEANGIWRSWIGADGTTRYQDEQYKVKLTGVKALEFDGSATAAGITLGTIDTTNFIDFGGDYTFTYTISGVTTDKFVRFDVSYQVYEGETLMTNDVYTTSVYTYLTNSKTDSGSNSGATVTNNINFGTYSPRYIDLSGDVWGQIQNESIVYIKREKSHGTQMWNLNISGTPAQGITPGTGTFAESLEKKYLGADTERYWDPFKIFTNGTYDAATDNKDKKPITVTGASFDKTQFTKKNGESLDLTFSFYGKLGSSCEANGDDVTGTATARLTFYDGAARNKLASEVTSELRKGRVSDDYEATGYSLADELLVYEAYTDEDGNEFEKNTTSNLTAWVNNDGDEVTGVTPDGEDETIGKYTDADGNEQDAKLVTKINNEGLWDAYVAALNTGATVGLNGLTQSSSFDFETPYTTLRAVANDLSYAAKEVTGDKAVASAIVDIKSELDTVESTYTDDYDYTDYMMWRLNRLNDAREDAQYYIDLKKDADRVIADVNGKYPYTSIEMDDLFAVVDNTENADVLDANDKLFIKALVESLTKEEYDAKVEWLEQRDKEYAEVTSFDVALADSILAKTSTRLRNREYKKVVNNVAMADTTYLSTEITSAEAMYPASDEALYTERSWAKYSAALEKAKAVLTDGTSQKNAFDAKWELLCCRNELVLKQVEGMWNEADYTELEALIDQAKWAIANRDLYDNTNKEFGQVLAELGLEGELVNADGYTVELFPGNALYINNEPYAIDEQGAIDQAAKELKEALARLKFKNVGVTANKDVGLGDVVINEAATIVFDDIDTKNIDETVTATLATISSGLFEDDVKALFNVTADDIFEGDALLPENITVSGDLHYSVEKFEKDPETGDVLDVIPYDGFVGTNAVVTFYTVQDNVKIPVATVKIVVKGDINGDGTTDVIDASQLNLVANQKAELDGCYYIAGNLAGLTDTERVIDANDYSAMMNQVLGCPANS